MAQSKLSQKKTSTSFAPGDPKAVEARAKAEEARQERGRTAIRHPALRRARAAQIIQMRITGQSNGQIAEQLQVSPDTVADELKWADQNGLIEGAEQQILEQLVPEAIRVARKHLKDFDNLDAAKLVISYLKTKSDQKAAKEARQEDSEHDLARYLAEKRAGSLSVTERGAAGKPAAAAPAQGLLGEAAPGLVPAPGPVVDAELVAAAPAGQDRQGAGEDSGVRDAAPGGLLGRADAAVDGAGPVER